MIDPGAWLLARRNLSVRRGRTALFLAGFALAVAVMITLLSVGDAIVEQARDKDLVGGGDLVLVPLGADVDVLKLGGVTAMYSSIPDARFVVRQLVGGARLAGEVARVEATWAGRPVYLRARGRVIQGLAGAGAVPGGPPAIAAAAWQPTAAESAFALPAGPAVYREIDHGHLPDPRHPDRGRWAEWDYFNAVDPVSGRFVYLSYFLAGDPRAGAVASLSVQVGGPDEPVVRYAFAAPADTTTIARDDVHVTIAASGALPPAVLGGARALGLHVDPSARATVRLVDGRYVLGARFHDLRTGLPVAVDLTLDPSPRAWGPPVTLRGDGGFESGYVVPMAIGRAHGTIDLGARRIAFAGAPAYHDHNWGYWRAVRWDWGQAQSDDGRWGLVYGAVHAPELTGTGAGRERRFAFLTSREGFVGAVEPDSFVAAGEGPAATVGGTRVPVPATIAFAGRRGDDTLAVRFAVASVAASRPLGDPRAAGPRLGAGRAFLQMRGTYRVRGRVGGREVDFTSPGAAETFVAVPATGAGAGRGTGGR